MDGTDQGWALHRVFKIYWYIFIWAIRRDIIVSNNIDCCIPISSNSLPFCSPVWFCTTSPCCASFPHWTQPEHSSFTRLWEYTWECFSPDIENEKVKLKLYFSFSYLVFLNHIRCSFSKCAQYFLWPLFLGYLKWRKLTQKLTQNVSRVLGYSNRCPRIEAYLTVVFSFVPSLKTVFFAFFPSNKVYTIVREPIHLILPPPYSY